MLIEDKDAVLRYYTYQPSWAGNATFLALATILVVLQTGMGIYYRQWWLCTTWVAGISLMMAGYIIRVYAAQDFFSALGYKVQYSMFIIAPTLIMAGVYYQMSKLLAIWGHHFARHRPMFYTNLFICSDVFSFLIQGGGGGMAAGGSELMNTGKWVAAGGIGFQLCSMSLFLFLFGRLVYRVKKAPEHALEPKYAHVRQRPFFEYLVPAVFICSALVYVRTAYRLAEMIDGFRGYLVEHEALFLVFDGMMMTVAMYTLTIIYPGVCYGRENIPLRGSTVFGRDEIELVRQMEAFPSPKSSM